MKKLLVLFASFLMLFTFVACGGDDDNGVPNMQDSSNKELLYGEWQSTSRKGNVVSKKDGSVDKWNEADNTWGLLLTSDGVGAITEYMKSSGFPLDKSKFQAMTWKVYGSNSFEEYIPVWRETRKGTIVSLSNTSLVLRIVVDDTYESGWYETNYVKVKDY
ncbi:MAG: hypothetical protein K5854_04325 [Prevotella sp.]|nr:hypothetical protein [Prevotella sp.]